VQFVVANKRPRNLTKRYNEPYNIDYAQPIYVFRI